MKILTVAIVGMCVYGLSAGQRVPAEPMEPDTLPAGGFTLGVLGGDDYTEGSGDLMVPLFEHPGGVLFLNPRASTTDREEQEYNLGLGYRHLLFDRQTILGVNAYYDTRDTRAGSTFDQIGFGMELLTGPLDLRANFYLPQDRENTVHTTSSREEETLTRTSRTSEQTWGDPYATGYSILQPYEEVSTTRRSVTTTTTTRYFEQLEVAMRGWDAEAGVPVPLTKLDEYVRMKLFAGYYQYRGRYGMEDLDGFRGRLELQLRPAFFIDATVYENDNLTGGNFTLAAYLSLPFDLARIAGGGNPFAGADHRWTATRRAGDLSGRLYDRVQRDPQIRTTITEPIEQTARMEAASETTSATTSETSADEEVLAENVTFVDGSRAGTEQDGTYEKPYGSVQQGVDAANSPVWVFDAGTPYEENVTVKENVQLYGNHVTLQGFGGKSWGGGTAPVIVGKHAGPVITIAGNNVTISGLEIRHSGAGNAGDVVDTVAGIDITHAGIYGGNVSGVTIEDIRMTDGSLEYGIVLAADGTMAGGSINLKASIVNNEISHTGSDALVVYGRGGSGTFDVEVSGTYSDSGGHGIFIDATGYDYDLAATYLHDIVVNGNSLYGILAWVVAAHSSQMTVHNVQADGNSVGAEIVAEAYGDAGEAALDVSNVSAHNNAQEGLRAGAASFHATGGDAFLTLQNVSVNGNQNDGAWIEVLTAGTDALASLSINGLEANGNLGDGMYMWVESDEGSAEAHLANITAMDNGGDGIDSIEVEANGTAGAAEIDMQNIHTTGNQDRGIREIRAYAADGPAVVNLSNVAAGGNDPYGIDYIVARSDGDNTFALITLENVTANNNARSGIFEITAQTTGDQSDAVVSLDGVTANNNGHYGLEYIQAITDGLNADATISVRNTVASGNVNADGIYQVTSQLQGNGGTANVLLENIVAEDNGGSGIARVEVTTSNGGDMNVLLSEVTTQNNLDHGIGSIQLAAYGLGGDVNLALLNLDAGGNSNHGINEIRATADEGHVNMLLDEILARLNGGFGIREILARANFAGASANVTFTDSDLTGNTAGGYDSILLEALGIGGSTTYTEINVQQ